MPARPGGRPTREVRLLRLPVPLAQASRLHHADLARELTLLVLSGAGDDLGALPSEEGPPVRIAPAIVDLLDDLREDLGGESAMAGLSALPAEATGLLEVDVVTRVPVDAGPRCARLQHLLDVAEDRCRAERLLTLAADPEVTRFRRWYLREHVSQLAGAPPQAWAG